MADKVLLVDDEVDFVETLGERMRARGMDVTTCTSALEALETLNLSTFDAIVLDLQMPELDGVELSRRIRDSSADTVIALMTGNPTEQVDDLLKDGIADHLFIKPFPLTLVCESLTSMAKVA